MKEDTPETSTASATENRTRSTRLKITTAKFHRVCWTGASSMAYRTEQIIAEDHVGHFCVAGWRTAKGERVKEGEVTKSSVAHYILYSGPQTNE
jgi:hypothetical protein